MIADGLNTGISAAADSVPWEYGDGKYRWVAELSMLKSFFLLFEVWKVLGIGALAVALLGAAVSLIGGSGPAGAAGSAGMAALVLGILLVLSVPSYWIVTRANNGKYTVLFEMDGAGISHTQIEKIRLHYKGHMSNTYIEADPLLFKVIYNAISRA